MNMQSALVVALMAVVIGSSAIAGEPGRALIDERWANGWSGWTVSNLHDIVTLEVKGDVLRLENKRAKGDKGISFFTIRSGLVKVEPGREFAVLMESRGNLDMRRPVSTFRAKENQIRAFIPATAVLWYTADRQPLLAQDASGVKLPTGSSFGFNEMNDTFSLTRHFDTVPAGAAYAALQIGGRYPSFHPGSWLELRRLALKMRDGSNGDWDFGDVAAPVIERVSPSPDPNPNAPFVFSAKDASKIVKLVCKLDGVDVSNEVKVKGEGEQRTFSVFHEPWANETLHRLEVEATDAAGNVGRETLATHCGPRPTGTFWSVRDDGVILRDGKPFFPIGTYGARPCPLNGWNVETMMAEFASNGFNFVKCNYAYRNGPLCYYDGASDYTGMTNHAALAAYHAAARKYGLLLEIEPGEKNYGTEKRTTDIVEALRFYRNCPEVMFYSLADDTASHISPEDLKKDYNICRAIDPLRLTAQPDANDYAGRYEPYAKATDIFEQEIYPFRNPEHEPAGLEQVIRNCAYAQDGLRKSGAKNRSIWTIPQTFAGCGLWHKYPHGLIRGQTFLAIICGCRGVAYYVYRSKNVEGFSSSREHAEEVYSVTRDVAAIADDLTSRDAKVQPKAEIVEGPKTDPGDHTSVSCLLKEGTDGNGRLLLTASSLVYGTVKAKIRLDVAQVETLFENGRQPDFRDGVLTETYKPGGVHVYRLKAQDQTGKSCVTEVPLQPSLWARTS